MKGVLIILIISLGFADLRNVFRLHHDAIPKSYQVSIRPSIDEASFTGEVTIFVELQTSIRNISLNSKNLKILKVALDSSAKNTAYELIPKDQILNIFYTDGELVNPGEHLIYIKFEGRQTNDSLGIFRSDIYSEGKRYISIATMFSASEARSAFPCFDEPAYKARFALRIIKPNETYMALGNTKKIASFPVEQGIAVDFRSTPPISPYLVCFVLTQMKYRSTNFQSIDGRIVPLRMFMLDEYLDQAPFFLDVAKRALKYFENYTNISYPLSKLDFIELHDFVFVGMENIGLVILEHNNISFNMTKGEAEVFRKRDGAQLIVHEIAHMWFGNIVTEFWYNDLWITEGMTEFMQIKALDHIYPKWQITNEELTLRRDNIFIVDALADQNTSVVTYPDTHEQVETQFDDFSYSKGSAIVVMLEMVMGPDVFQRAIREYLKEYSFSIATTGDFVNAIQKNLPDVNLLSFFETWLYQNRYPLLTVSQSNGSEDYIVTQQNVCKNQKGDSIFGYKWTVPVFYLTSCNSSRQMIWFDKDAEKLRVPKCKNETWIKFNAGANGLYRVLYTQEQYDQLLKHFDKLPELDQANLITETYSLMTKEYLNCEVPLNFMKKMKGKTSFIPVLTTLEVLESLIQNVRDNTMLYDKFRKFFIDIFQEQYDKFVRTEDVDDHVERILRYQLFLKMCNETIKYSKCLKDVKAMVLRDQRTRKDLSGVLNIILKYTSKPSTEGKNATEEQNSIPNSDLNITTSTFVKNCKKWITKNL